jgi:hypothetical protein
MSKASVDLPEPLTPVTTLNWPRGMLTLSDLRLCSRALTIWMARRPPWPGGARGLDQGCSGTPSSARWLPMPSARSYSRRAWPVCEVACWRTSSGVPSGDDQAAGVAAFGAEVDQPVAGADHVEVVLDHHQRVAGIQQLAQGAHQLGDVVEVQARWWARRT